MTRDQIARFLLRSPLFQGLDKASVAELAAHVRVVEWPRGQVVLRKGEPGDAMMIVVQGRVKIVTVAPNGRESILNIIEPGESFGETALLDGGPRSADAVAAVRTTALLLGRTAFAAYLGEHIEFALKIIADLCERLRRTTELVEDTLFLDPPTRVARRLRALVHDVGSELGDGRWSLEGFTQQDLADSTGLTRESVNKVLAMLRAEGLVTLERRSVIVHDAAALDRLARRVGG